MSTIKKKKHSSSNTSLSSIDMNKALWRACWVDDTQTVFWALEKNGKLTCVKTPPFYERVPKYKDEKYKID